MQWLFGQTWMWIMIAFVLGLIIGFVIARLFRKKEVDVTEERVAAGPQEPKPTRERDLDDDYGTASGKEGSGAGLAAGGAAAAAAAGGAAGFVAGRAGDRDEQPHEPAEPAEPAGPVEAVEPAQDTGAAAATEPGETKDATDSEQPALAMIDDRGQAVDAPRTTEDQGDGLDDATEDAGGRPGAGTAAAAGLGAAGAGAGAAALAGPGREDDPPTAPEPESPTQADIAEQAPATEAPASEAPGGEPGVLDEPEATQMMAPPTPPAAEPQAPTQAATASQSEPTLPIDEELALPVHEESGQAVADQADEPTPPRGVAAQQSDEMPAAEGPGSGPGAGTAAAAGLGLAGAGAGAAALAGSGREDEARPEPPATPEQPEQHVGAPAQQPADAQAPTGAIGGGTVMGESVPPREPEQAQPRQADEPDTARLPKLSANEPAPEAPTAQAPPAAEPRAGFAQAPASTEPQQATTMSGQPEAPQDPGESRAFAAPEAPADPESGSSPFGRGSAVPAVGGAAPSDEYTVKGSTDSMMYQNSASPYYPRTVADVWFRSPADAEAAGFTAWNKPRPRPAEATGNPTWEPGRYPGSARPLADGSRPTSAFTVKASEDSRLYHTTDSPYYTRTIAQVWFKSAADAETAGFTAWNRPR